MRKNIVLITMLLVLALTALSMFTLDNWDGSAQGTELRGVVNVNSMLHVRSAPSESADSLGAFSSGEVVTITSVESDWGQVQFNGHTGYVHMDYVKLEGSENTGSNESSAGNDNPGGSEDAGDLEQMTVTASVLNIRAEPSLQSSVIGNLQRNAEVEVTSYTAGWAQITLNSGLTGYVYADYLSSTAQSSQTASVSSTTDTNTNTQTEAETSSDEAGSGETDSNGARSTGSGGSVSGKVIVLDPGHGGHDPGGMANHLVEKEITLDIAMRLKNRLQSEGATVILTRDKDEFVSRESRVAVSNQHQPDVFVSIHANYHTAQSVQGTETFYSVNSVHAQTSLQLAQAMQNRVVYGMNMFDRGVKVADFDVLYHNEVPSVLVELGFLSHTGDATKLSSSRDRYTEALVNGLQDYFRQN